MTLADFESFYVNSVSALASHGMQASVRDFAFSSDALRQVESGNWDKCAVELATKLKLVLSPILAPNHEFCDAPYVREVDLPDGRKLFAAIINQQSKEWYGSDHFIATCDFLIPSKLGVLRDCKSYLDLGGHQLIWASYYAGTHTDARVTTFEPSILNVLIGAFNCLINGVIDRVEIVPFAVKAEGAPSRSEADKMLVDFLKVPLRTTPLSEHVHGHFDFTKTDIEGYEFEMLGDAVYVDLLKSASFSHFELHLGHLIRRGISREDCVSALKRAGLQGVELYSGQEMYDFLSNCDRSGYFAFRL